MLLNSTYINEMINSYDTDVLQGERQLLQDINILKENISQLEENINNTFYGMFTNPLYVFVSYPVNKIGLDFRMTIAHDVLEKNNEFTSLVNDLQPQISEISELLQNTINGIQNIVPACVSSATMCSIGIPTGRTLVSSVEDQMVKLQAHLYDATAEHNELYRSVRADPRLESIECTNGGAQQFYRSVL